MKLSELAKEIEGARITGGDAEILSLAQDSRVAGRGDLFFAYREEPEVRDYAAEAEKRGAAAILSERETGASLPHLLVPDARVGMSRGAAWFYGHPERKLKTVGVTGTNGKTTVTRMIRSILLADGKRAGDIGTLGAEYGETVVSPALTTPDPISLFSLLSEMVRGGMEYAVLEVSAHALALGKVEPIFFDVACFTNLTQDHLDFFGDMGKYGQAKARLFTGGHCREAVLNADDPFSRTLGEGATYGLDCPADNFAVIEEEKLSGTRALLNLEDELVEVTIPLVGRHNVSNALAAAVSARRLGVRLGAVAGGIRKTRVEGRLERVGEKEGAVIFVDFAHTPDGIRASLEALRPFVKGRLILLFGCGGNRDRAKRPLMGEVAAKYADFSVLTSDNPRYEEPSAILAAVEEGYRRHSRSYVVIEEREAATEYAIGKLGQGDVLLIAGKGGETEQEIMGIKYAYNDKTIVKRLLEKS